MQLYPYEQEHIETLRKIAPECMVLLKSDGSFPLKQPETIALYGSGARNTIKGGTGSGDVNVRHFTTIEEGLEKAGFSISTKSWLDAYEEVHKNVHKTFVNSIKEEAKEKGIPAIMLGMGAVMPEPEYEIPLEGAGDTAIYVLARVSGEGSDRRVVPGDFQLTETEIRDIYAISRQYEKFLLVLNVGGVIDLNPVTEIKNILLLSQVGMTIGDSFADVLLGKSYPSGKLTATWAGWEDYCQIGNFGKEDDTRYKEGIYVGYRYFDTVQKTPLYPFGYGISYTTFSIQKPEVSVSKTKISVKAVVKNTGDREGREIVQLYVSVPSERLDQPFQKLAAFSKTKELGAGETQEVALEFFMEDLVSFDAERCAYILEAGDYVLRIGNSSRNTEICGVIRLAAETIVEEVRHAGGEADFIDWIPEIKQSMPEQEIQDRRIPVFALSREDFQKKEKYTAPEKDKELLELLDTMSDSELAYLCIGGFKEKGSDSIIGNAGMGVAGSAGETTRRYIERGIPNLIMADGPAGLRLSRQYRIDKQGVHPVGDEVPASMLDFIDDQTRAMFARTKKTETQETGEIHDQYCSAIPVGVALAQSWNLELCEQCGNLVGEEMDRFGVHLWLAPALNIHRSPLCGRNFEYYSEDPLISGKMAAAITKGVQSHSGCGVSVKHFACNNQETNRFHSNSIVSERALRDIYLRGFQIVVREAHPHTVMTSYNLLNGEHTSQRVDLIKQVLREEWGFRGIVMSDWVISGIGTGLKNKYPYACASGSIKAGNDIMMPGGEKDHADLMSALSEPEHPYHITREELKECAYRVCEIAKSGVYARL